METIKTTLIVAATLGGLYTVWIAAWAFIPEFIKSYRAEKERLKKEENKK